VALTKINYNQIKGSCINAFDYMSAAQIADITSFTGSVDCTAALDLAFANVGQQVFLPAGLYLVSTNLASPTCGGIFGEGWTPGAVYEGTFLLIKGTVGLRLRNAFCLTVRDLCLQGNNALTDFSTGILIGDSPAAPSATVYTWDYGKITNVQITNFSGNSSRGMYLRDANFCTFTDLHIANCVMGLETCVANTTAGGTPADCWFYNATISSIQTNGVMMRSGYVIFDNLRLSGCLTEAFSMWPIQGEITSLSAIAIIRHPQFENMPDSLYQFRLEGTVAQNACTLVVDDAWFEMGAGQGAFFVEAKGAYAKAYFNKPMLYDVTNVPTSWIQCTNGASLSISNSVTFNNVDTAYDVSDPLYCTTDTASQLLGNNMMRIWTPSFSVPLTIVGAATYVATAVTAGNLVHWSLRIIPTGAGTTASVGATFICGGGAFDLGAPRTGSGNPLNYAVNVAFESRALSATTSGEVYNSGNKFICVCPNWPATNDEVQLSGTYYVVHRAIIP
jgi:hypothetical protein